MSAMKFAPMSRSEAKRLMIAAYPGRSVTIDVSDRHYIHPPDRPHDSMEFRVAIIPGLGEKGSQHWHADTLGGAVRLALEAGLAQPPTPGQLDGYYREEAEAFVEAAPALAPA